MKPHLTAVCVLVSWAVHAGETADSPSRKPLGVSEAALIPSDERPELRGKSRLWLLGERARVDAARPSARWYIGAVSLSVVGTISVLAGSFNHFVDTMCWFGNTCAAASRLPSPITLGLWRGGGAAALSGLLFSAILAVARATGDARLGEVERALEALPREPRFDGMEELR